MSKMGTIASNHSHIQPYLGGGGFGGGGLEGGGLGGGGLGGGEFGGGLQKIKSKSIYNTIQTNK